MDKTYHSFGVLAAAAAGVLAAVGMLMLTILVVDEPAGAAFPGENGKIAFESNRDGNAEIYTMNPNGQGIDRLTNNPAGDFFPAWQRLSPAPNPKPPNPEPPNTTTAPKVLSTSPKANAKGVAPTASLKATFSEKMRASSITGKTFKLFKKKGSTTKELSARVTYDAATKKATLDPTTSLRRGVTYEAVVSTGAKDASGNSLDQNPTTKGLQQKAWSFTVRR
jgi:Bacterial Ig-like domain